MTRFITTHAGPCCDSCIEDQAYSSDYLIYDEDWNLLCCCYELKRPVAS